jgi:hypothetical protein
LLQGEPLNLKPSENGWWLIMGGKLFLSPLLVVKVVLSWVLNVAKVLSLQKKTLQLFFFIFLVPQLYMFHGQPRGETSTIWKLPIMLSFKKN